MAVTGIATDGALVFDDRIDDRGRFVIDVTNRILQDGTHYISTVTAVVLDPAPTDQLTQSGGMIGEKWK